MTNKYLIQAGDPADDLGLDATVMAHTDAEALEQGRKYINGNHDLHLSIDDVSIANVEYAFDGQHDIVEKSSKDGDWVELWIDDRLLESGHSLSVQHVIEALQSVTGEEFTFKQEELPSEDDDGNQEE